LAAVLLKVGAYGFIRFLIPLFKISSIENTKLVCVLAVIGMLYSSYVAIRQIDMKKMIAYSSISHMNFIVLGIFSFDYLSLYGALVLMLGHAVVSSALFFLSGVLYDRYHTRSIEYFGGAAHTMPIFSIFLFIFLIANMGFPCSPSFIGEFFIFLGVVSHFGPIVTILVSFTLVLNTCFNIRLFSKIVFGPVNGINGVIYQDLTKKELKILISFLSCSLALFFLHFYYMSFFTYNLSLYFNLYV
jgi:NADH-quinone oxidoreductase subunit M